MKGFLIFCLGMSLGYWAGYSQPAPAPAPKQVVTYTPDTRPSRILDANDNIIWEKNQ